MPKRDTNQTAFDVVRRATREEVAPAESAKASAGRKGGQKGGVARVHSTTAEQRKKIAQGAANARWGSRRRTP